MLQRMRLKAIVVDGTIRIERPRGHELVREVVEAFGDEIDSVTFGKPTLEDVFVHLTGHRFFADASERAESSRARAQLQVATLWWREITRFRRQRSRVIGAFLQPLVFWLLLGAGLSASFRPSGMPAGINYVEYFYPGVIVLVLLFTAIFATISTVEDRKQGFLQGVLVAPISRVTVVMGQALGGTTLALVQGIIFLVLAPLAGIHLSAGRGRGLDRDDDDDRVRAHQHRAGDRVANRIDAGLSRDHEPDPDSDLAAVGRVLPRRRRARMAGMDDAAESADLRYGGAAQGPVSRRAGRHRRDAKLCSIVRDRARLRGDHVSVGQPHRPPLVGGMKRNLTMVNDHG